MKKIILISLIALVAVFAFGRPTRPPESAIIPNNTELASSPSTPSKSQESPTNLTDKIVPEPVIIAQMADIPNVTLPTRSPLKVIIKDGIEYPNRRYEAFTMPNDPSANQWWVAPNGMETVWSLPSGGYQTKIAIIDTGFALAHQDLSDRYLTNPGETGLSATENPSILNCTARGLALNESCNLIDDDFDRIVDNESWPTSEQNPSRLNCTARGLALTKNCNNIDDDNNGYIDDYSGWDFVNFDASPQAGEVNPNGSSIAHGTMVAGVAAASGNNSVGIAGVNWNTKILPIQALSDNGYGDTFTVASSVYYAVSQNVDIISISLGTSANDPYLRQAILYALDRGVLIVAASGNDGCNCISYPARYPEVIAVGAINPSGNPASFSNYGTELDILAPGQSIATTTYSAANPTSAYAGNVAGTSFSTPFVSGLIALGKSNQPTATWEEIIGAMFENSDRRDLSASTPRSDTLGFGVVRANTMVNRTRSATSEAVRYQLGSSKILGSEKSYQCSGSTIPASRLYELKKLGIAQYTSNLRSLSASIQSDWSSRLIAHTCMGLPGDLPQVLRLIDLPKEISNTQTKQ